MLVYVPQDYVALVYENGELRAVLEAGVGLVAPAAKQQVQYVYLQPQAEVSEEADAAVTLQ